MASFLSSHLMKINYLVHSFSPLLLHMEIVSHSTQDFIIMKVLKCFKPQLQDQILVKTATKFKISLDFF